MVNAPEEGVGVEQSLGFIELPVEGESTAGWSLSDSDDSVLALGELSGSGGSFLADQTPDQLYDTLNVNQEELLFKAQRDNYLKSASNDYLNREFNRVSLATHLMSGTLANARNQWTPAGDAYGGEHLVLIELRFDKDADLHELSFGVEDGLPKDAGDWKAVVVWNPVTSSRKLSLEAIRIETGRRGRAESLTARRRRRLRRGALPHRHD